LGGQLAFRCNDKNFLMAGSDDRLGAACDLAVLSCGAFAE
jgi:hypothetical protein